MLTGSLFYDRRSRSRGQSRPLYEPVCRRRSGRKEKVPEPAKPMLPPPEVPPHPIDPVDMRRQNFQTPGMGLNFDIL